MKRISFSNRRENPTRVIAERERVAAENEKERENVKRSKAGIAGAIPAFYQKELFFSCSACARRNQPGQSTHIRLQCSRNGDAAVGLLEVFQQGD